MSVYATRSHKCLLLPNDADSLCSVYRDILHRVCHYELKWIEQFNAPRYNSIIPRKHKRITCCIRYRYMTIPPGLSQNILRSVIIIISETFVSCTLHSASYHCWTAAASSFQVGSSGKVKFKCTDDLQNALNFDPMLYLIAADFNSGKEVTLIKHNHSIWKSAIQYQQWNTQYRFRH